MRDMHAPQFRISANGGGRLLCLLPLILVLAAAPMPLHAQSAGAIRGVVRDSVGGVVANARVAIRGTAIQAISDADGAYRLARVPAGGGVLEARRLGYRPAATPVNVSAGSELQIDVELSPVPEQLAPVQVRREAEVFDSRLAGFNARKSKHVGYIVTRERLDRMSSARFVDALRQMPGLSIRTLRGGVVTVSLRGARCSPIFYMDGFPSTAGTMDLDMIDLAGVEGIEVYSGMSSTPAEFMTVEGTETCGVIAVWSRPFRPKPRPQEVISQADLERLVAEHTVFTAAEVTEPATLLRGRTAVPEYPDSLWEAEVPGRVVAEFIVGQDGRIEPGTLTIASATHPYFAQAVRTALEGAVFNPATLRGQPVMQLVQLPFVFDPIRPAHDSSSVSR
jgi:Carboxypeptidase regulatory-like domain/TonB-dependent Receptor Plug Domain/Gram-negative bacterial TonB protein C-terminal